jgi:type I restriction enzyme S subunit
MENQRMIKLGALCTSISSGGTPSRKRADFFTDSPDGIPWVKSKELLENGIDSTEERITQLCGSDGKAVLTSSWRTNRR